MGLEDILTEKVELAGRTPKIITVGCMSAIGGFATSMVAGHELVNGFNSVDAAAWGVGFAAVAFGSISIGSHLLEQIDLVEEERHERGLGEPKPTS